MKKSKNENICGKIYLDLPLSIRWKKMLVTDIEKKSIIIFFRTMKTMFEKLEAISETSLRRSKRNNCCFKVKKKVHPGVQVSQIGFVTSGNIKVSNYRQYLCICKAGNSLTSPPFSDLNAPILCMGPYFFSSRQNITLY